MKRTPSERRENTTLTGEEQAKNDNLTVEEVSINFNFDDLDFSFDDFEIDLDIDLSFDDFNFDFLNEQKTNRRTNRERTKRKCKNQLWANCENEARAKPEKNNIELERKSRTKPRGSQEEAVKNPLEAVRKRWVFGVFGVHKKGNEARTKQEEIWILSHYKKEIFPTIKKNTGQI